MEYRLYVRHASQGRFRPVDWRRGRQVVNLIYASLFTAEERARVEQDLQTTRAQGVENVGMAWEWRRT